MKNKITTWKSTVTQGLRLGSISFLLLTIFTCFLHYIILSGESYIGKSEINDIINGISFCTVNVLCGILATVVPIFFLRYTRITFLILILFISSCTYLLLYIVCVCCGEFISFGLLYPMEEFDTIIYALISFPVGSCVGTMVSVITNTVINNK